ncbi:secretory phospholipase A2 receptor-like [Silurus meridionalis]|uniref:secretory phospholipase A2 receptor-like n=1 Tax=Silurus meridionalis TaxID=175797 RepID=UPI001EEC900F|nr:secretory phospholipase A2 receptor-like [Silurus meridionalis]
MTWTEAQSYCREHYTDLPSVRNQTDNHRIFNLTGGSAAWIGLYRTRLWSDKKESAYENWRPAIPNRPAEPDNGVNTMWQYNNQHCTAVSFRDSGQWTDEYCFATLPFICYNSTHDRYVWIYNSMTWEDAQRFCRANHRDLASVRNETELQRILNITNGFEVWIGLYRNRLWSDQSSSTFTYWRPQIPAQTPEPDNGAYLPGQSGIQHCTAVDRSGHWTDEDCFARFPFICYTAFTPDVVTGLRIKVKAKESLLHSEIPKLVLIELYQELNRLGLSNNISVNVIKKRKFSP